MRREVLKATRAALKGRADEKGLLHAGGSGVVRVSVSRDQISRVIALIDQVLAGAESRGMQVVLVPLTSPWSRDKATQVQIVDRDLGFTFSVKEQSTRTPHEPTAAEKARQSKYSWATPPDGTTSRMGSCVSTSVKSTLGRLPTRATDLPMGSQRSSRARSRRSSTRSPDGPTGNSCALPRSSVSTRCTPWRGWPPFSVLASTIGMICELRMSQRRSLTGKG